MTVDWSVHPNAHIVCRTALPPLLGEAIMLLYVLALPLGCAKLAEWCDGSA